MSDYIGGMRRRYMLLRLSMNMCVYVGSVLVCSATSVSVYNNAMRILGIRVGEQ